MMPISLSAHNISIDSMSDEILDLIRQLQQLEIRQADLLARLHRARINETTRGFTVGDEVRIKNPRNPKRAEENYGVISKIGAARITVLTKGGRSVQRAPKNLSLEDI